MDLRKLAHRMSTPITLVVLLGLLCVGVLWGYKAVTAKVEGPPPPNCIPIPMTELTPDAVTVNVYNGGSQRGLAGRIADALEAGGFVIADIDNTEVRVLTILIIGAAVDNPEVLLVAGWFVDPQIQADSRPDHSVDVILGGSYDEATGMTESPPMSLEIPSGEVCLPKKDDPTPSATPTDATPAPTDTPT